jgi:type IV secretory pathway protease TraF
MDKDLSFVAKAVGGPILLIVAVAAIGAAFERSMFGAGIAVGAVLGVVGTLLFKRSPKADVGFFRCPYCSEPVRTGATVCKSCHRSLSKSSATSA